MSTAPMPLAPGIGAFEVGDVLRHVKRGSYYVIIKAPPIAVLEATGEPAYIYRSVLGDDPRWWCRAQHEIEDGRFVLHKKRPL